MTGEKKKQIRQSICSVLVTFLFFLMLISFVVTCSFLLFFNSVHLTEEQVRMAAPYTFANIVFLTIVFVLVDTLRNKIMIDRPIRRMKGGMKQIMKGNFDVRIKSEITDDRRKFEEIIKSINRMTEELSGVETLRTDFIANVSHELKTPLAVIQNYGTMLQAPVLLEERRIEYAKAVTEASRRLASLVTNILKLNRLENQQIYPDVRRYNLGEQLCECLLTFEDDWEKKQLNIQNDIDEDVWVSADAELLSLVWNNLFSNAVKFNTVGGTIGIRLKTQDDFAVIEVSDTGCGISKEAGGHIFEKFYQGDTSHATQGNGLGLALVKKVVDIMGGEIFVESTVGQGSTFLVKLRRAVDEQTKEHP